MRHVRDETTRGRILIVDDDPATLQLFSVILEGAGYTHIDLQSDPNVVLSLFHAHSYDLVILDLVMPGLSGLDILRQLQTYARCAYLPVIVLTAQNDRATRLACLNAGAKEFLVKPIDPVEVLARIENVMMVSLLLKEREERAAALEQAVTRRTEELSQSRRQLIQSLARAGEYHDTETGSHIARIGRYCYALARAIGWSKRHAELLQEASPMHDVGKIGVPETILLKPSHLTEGEIRDMRRHPLIGADILQGGSVLLDIARTVALTHHERWDGSGYPYGLSGDDIPAEGRIVAICDVFDALISGRPYKRDWTLDRAFAAIRDGAGKEFDPVMVEAFLTIRPQIEAIYHALHHGTPQPLTAEAPLPTSLSVAG